MPEASRRRTIQAGGVPPRPPPHPTGSWPNPSMARRSISAAGSSGTGTNSRNQERGTRIDGSSELPQQAQVVLPEQPDVGNAVARHHDAVAEAAEGKGGVALRVDAGHLQHAGGKHAAPAQFQPRVV